MQRPEIITIRSLETGEERDLSPNLSFIWGPIRWSPDGRSILVAGKDSTARHALYLVDARSAKATQVDMWQDAIDIPTWFPDGKRLLYRSWKVEAGAVTQAILVRDLGTGQETEFFRPTPGVAWWPPGPFSAHSGAWHPSPGGHLPRREKFHSTRGRRARAVGPYRWG